MLAGRAGYSEEKRTRDLAAHVPILLVDGLVLGLVGGAHVPVESILESGRVVIVLDLLKLYRLPGDGAGGLDEMCFGFGDEPVGEGCWDVGPFLLSAMSAAAGEGVGESSRGKGAWERHTPFNRSKMTRMATQNSSKSRLPSPSTSARSQTRASWSSLRPLFLSTGAAISPVRNLPPLVRVEKMFQYVSISCASIRGGAMAAVWVCRRGRRVDGESLRLGVSSQRTNGWGIVESGRRVNRAVEGIRVVVLVVLGQGQLVPSSLMVTIASL